MLYCVALLYSYMLLYSIEKMRFAPLYHQRHKERPSRIIPGGLLLPNDTKEVARMKNRSP